ncbi:MAG: acyl-[ACP]--phospholipid O-acyltransferase [Alphaproteobacteria bacterium]|nr:acyl-[ACP]--phospholipid O-acyltransferase [Alphaproteobacteria bacterium]
MKNIIKNKPFWALFGVQFLQAFNDNFFRTTLITLITYHLTIYSVSEKSLFVSTAFGLFMLPFFLFSPLAGQLADAYDKSRIIRTVKVAELLIVSISAYGFIEKDPYFLLGALFFMGIHSSFFGPAKYSIMPDILAHENLLKGNGYIEAGTFFAIMLGTLCGALMIHMEVPLYMISLQLFFVAFLGLIISWQIPVLSRAAPRLKIHLNWMFEMKRLYRYASYEPRVFKAIVSIGWFWLVGTLFLTQLPPLAHGVLKLEESIYIFLLLGFTLGIGCGSVLCNWFFKGEITTKYVPLLAFLMVPVLFDISSFSKPFGPTTTVLSTFLTSFEGLRLIADILSLSFLGGLFIVPLYTFIQVEVLSRRRSQIIAFNNILNAGFMVFASAASYCLLRLNFTIPTLIFLCAMGQVVMTFYVIRILPESAFRTLLYGLLRLFFRLEVHGLENYSAAGSRVILIANHTSYLDALLIAAVLPEKPAFAVNLYTAQKWWIKPFLVLAKVFPIDPTSPYALRQVIEEAKKGHKVIIFPEGRLTTTGSLMKIYEGPGMIAEKAEATLLPIRIEGAQYTFFSLLKGPFPRHFFPKITLTILPSFKLPIDPEILGRARRHQLSEQLYDVMTTMMFSTSSFHKTLFTSLLESRKRYGSSTPILEDATRTTFTYGAFLLKVFTLSRLMDRAVQGKAPVGLMLPNTHGLVVSFWALSAIGRIPALLNYTSGAQAILAACRIANIKTIFTSRVFVEKAHLQDLITLLKTHKIHVHYLENERKKISWLDKGWGIYGRIFPERAYKKKVSSPQPDEAAVILFTSGSEGVPKAVVLSHINLLANCRQLGAIVDFNEKDKVLNVLPIFHAFGLTAGMILPLLSGIKAFHYVSPLHYRVVAELVYDIGATILFGADTFLYGYGRVAHAYDFHTLRYVFAGAERLKEETRRVWYDKFGLRPLEGYGTTETGPVLCVNTMMHYKAGTVGRFLPGITYRLKSVEGLLEGGRLSVKGPNIMKGYLLDSSPGILVPPHEGWYDTGDIVHIDEEGYVTIKGRAARFAKVGGEMISLMGVEDALYRLWPEYVHAVIAQPDQKKGEQLLLLTTFPTADRTALMAFWKGQGLSDLSLPRVIKILPSLPLLGSGKIDYKALEALAHP